jgi:LysR family transcriptional regulator, low CO2-responsive transcriptional regulator
MDGVTLDGLHCFTVFAEHRNFTRAAAELHISQPALHVKVSKLAQALGVVLYEREGRDLRLTEAGTAVARFAAELEQRLHRFVGGLHAPEAAALVLAAGEGTHLHVIAEGVRRLLASGTPLRLLTADADGTVAAVSDGRADLGVLVLGRRPAGLRVRHLATYPQVVVLPAGHPLARRRTLRLRDLDGATLVLSPPGRPHRRAIDTAMRRAGARGDTGVEVEGWAQMQHFVSLGVGLAIVNGCVAPREGLVHRPLVDLPNVTYAAVAASDAASDPRLDSVLDVLEASTP